jgi:hypothetical protein
MTVAIHRPRTGVRREGRGIGHGLKDAPHWYNAGILWEHYDQIYDQDAVRGSPAALWVIT